MSAYERLSAQDSSFVMFEHRATHMHVSAVAIFETAPLATVDGGLDVGRVSRHIESRLHLIPRYRQKLAFTPVQRHPIWVDDQHFNLNYHVRHTSLPQPGDQHALKRLVGRVVSQHLDREKPLWEIWLVEGLEGGAFAMVTKVHHSMVDGAAGVNLMTLLLSASPEESAEPARPWVPRAAPAPLQLLIEEGMRRAKVPLSLLRGVRSALERPRAAWESLAETGDAVWQALRAGFQIPSHTPVNRAIGPHRRIDWYALELTEVLAASNHVSGYFLSLPIHEPDPLRRVARVKEDTRRLKQSKAALGIDLLTRFVDWSGSTLLTLAGVRLASRLQPYNLIVTNVPGPQYPLYLLGARMLEIYPQLPLFENQGLGVAVMSYDGKVFWGLVGDWDLVPDLSDFAGAVDAAYRELRDAAEGR